MKKAIKYYHPLAGIQYLSPSEGMSVSGDYELVEVPKDTKLINTKRVSTKRDIRVGMELVSSDEMIWNLSCLD